MFLSHPETPHRHQLTLQFNTIHHISQPIQFRKILRHHLDHLLLVRIYSVVSLRLALVFGLGDGDEYLVGITRKWQIAEGVHFGPVVLVEGAQLLELEIAGGVVEFLVGERVVVLEVDPQGDVVGLARCYYLTPEQKLVAIGQLGQLQQAHL